MPSLTPFPASQSNLSTCAVCVSVQVAQDELIVPKDIVAELEGLSIVKMYF